MRTPEGKNKKFAAHASCFQPSLVYDFDLCADVGELRRMIHHINCQGYILVGVTQDLSGMYTVFFRRPVCG